MNQQYPHHPGTSSGYPAGAMGQDGSGERLRKLQVMLAGRWHYAIILTLLGTVAGAWGVYELITPLYRSQGSVQVLQFSEHNLPDTEEQRIRNLRSYVRAQIEMILSGDVITEAMKTQQWRDHGRPMSPVEFATKVQVSDYGGRRNRDEEIFEVAFVDDTPASAHAGIQALLTSYEDWHNRVTYERQNRRLQVLDTMRADARNDIDQITRDMLRLAPDRVRGVRYRIEREQEALALIEQRLEETREALRHAPESMESDSDDHNSSIDSLIPRIAEVDPHMRALYHQVQAERTQVRYLETNFGLNHNSARRARQRLAALESNMREYAWTFPLERLPSQFFGGRVELTALEADLAEQHRRMTAQLNALHRTELQMEQLEARRTRAEEHLARVEQSIDAALAANRVDDSPVRILSAGALPLEPYNSGQRKQMAVLGGAGGGAAGASIILLIGMLDRRLRDSEDVKWSTGNTGLLGVLPALPRDLSDPDQAAIASNCVHHIRALLQVADDQEPGRVFSVTSPASGTGKTSLSLALGLSFAESGSRTLLVDGDLFGGQLSARVNAIVRQRIGQILRHEGKVTESQLDLAMRRSRETGDKLGATLVSMGVLSEDDVADALDMQADSRLGILDAIGGEELRQCVAETGYKDLSILPIGPAQPHDAGRLSPTSIRGLFHEALKHYDIVLVDTGPVPASLEASVVAAEADGVILTVSRGEQRPLAVKARRHLEAIGAQVAGIVFNRADGREVESYSYRPRSIAGDRAQSTGKRLSKAARKAAMQVKADQRSVTFGPIARAVSLSSPPDVRREGNSNGHSRNNGSSNGNGRT